MAGEWLDSIQYRPSSISSVFSSPPPSLTVAHRRLLTGSQVKLYGFLVHRGEMGETGEQGEKFYIGLDFSTQQVGVGGSGSQSDSHQVRCILEKTGFCQLFREKYGGDPTDFNNISNSRSRQLSSMRGWRSQLRPMSTLTPCYPSTGPLGVSTLQGGGSLLQLSCGSTPSTC